MRLLRPGSSRVRLQSPIDRPHQWSVITNDCCSVLALLSVATPSLMAAVCLPRVQSGLVRPRCLSGTEHLMGEEVHHTSNAHIRHTHSTMHIVRLDGNEAAGRLKTMDFPPLRPFID